MSGRSIQSMVRVTGWQTSPLMGEVIRGAPGSGQAT